MLKATIKKFIEFKELKIYYLVTCIILTLSSFYLGTSETRGVNSFCCSLFESLF